MRKLIAASALLLAIAAPARAGLTHEQVDDLVWRIKYRYIPMGLTAPEIVILVRDLYNAPYVVVDENPDGSVSFMYEDRAYPGGPIRYLGLIYRGMLKTQAAPVMPAAPN
ncbi:hypothetical protein [Pseudoduganella chitinolytica]|uniref:DUF3192 domain-containing protein n=1 Tax=Pseudoduganella chitinolytica TaxID=34070 RepID=A0ABY8BHR9_9BURK|nr:hypothetical protein [Pseudoduganella chitinolytica]WEF34913.1 hypothetical protein PX653_09175 [Pseudoduganella chitinolytica]